MTLGLLLAGVFTFGHVSSAPPPVPSPPEVAPTRYLVICVDGVGYDLVEEMHRRGELPHFQPPVPLITAFPSLTNTGLVEILSPLGAPPARGYEDYYFDPAGNRMRGGFFHRFSGKHFIDNTFRELFHYHPSYLRMTLEYALPFFGPWINGSITLGRIKSEFRESTEPLFLAYFDSSDPAAHVSGKWLIRHFLRRLDRLAHELTADARHPVEVIVFYDHGNDFQRLRKAKLEGALERAGFRLQRKLQNPFSVVMPKYGLVGSAVLYTYPGQEAAVGKALRRAEGVDLIAYQRADGLLVLSRQGTARIERRRSPEGEWYRYQADGGDPLQLVPILKALEAEGEVDGDGFVPQDTWLQATAHHVYPDPLRRLWGGFDGLIAQPASILVSLADGYYTGSLWLDLFAFLRATHGNLGRMQSVGIVLSTSPQLVAIGDQGAPEPLTGGELLARISLLEDDALPVRPQEESLLALLPRMTSLARDPSSFSPSLLSRSGSETDATASWRCFP